MTKPWAEMTPREQDAALAGLMGWRVEHRPADDGRDRVVLINPAGEVVADGYGHWWVGWGLWGFADHYPHYTTDLNAAAQVEAEIERRGMWVNYTRTLRHITWRHTTEAPYDYPDDADWRLARATAAQRCEAAYIVLTGASA